jgi:hypothetical protein
MSVGTWGVSVPASVGVAVGVSVTSGVCVAVALGVAETMTMLSGVADGTLLAVGSRVEVITAALGRGVGVGGSTIPQPAHHSPAMTATQTQRAVTDRLSHPPQGKPLRHPPSRKPAIVRRRASQRFIPHSRRFALNPR